MTEIIDAIRSHKTDSAESALSDLAYAVQSLRRVPGMTKEQHKRLFTMSCEIDSIYVQIGEGK